MRASFHPFLNLLILSLNNIEYNLKPENIQQKTGYPGFRKVFHFLLFFFIWIFLKTHSRDFFFLAVLLVTYADLCFFLFLHLKYLFIHVCLRIFVSHISKPKKLRRVCMCTCVCITAIWNIVKMSFFFFFTLPLNAYTYNKSFKLYSRFQYNDEMYEGNIFSQFSTVLRSRKIIRQEIKNCENMFRRSLFLMNACLYIFSIANFYFMLIKQQTFSFSNLLEFTKKGCWDFKSSSEWKLDEGNGFFLLVFITFLFLAEFTTD